MKIKWLGHAAFAITSEKGKVLITDPYEAGAYNNALRYPPIRMQADFLTISHDHADHNSTKGITGNPKIFNRTGLDEAKDIKVKGIATFHDTTNGSERGKNIVFVIEMDGLRMAHLGDLGHELNQSQLNELGKIDILFCPVGGHFTIDAKQASAIVQKIAPRIVIPMHYKTDMVEFPISPVEDFLKGKIGIKRLGVSETTVTKDTLPAQPEIWVLTYTR